MASGRSTVSVSVSTFRCAAFVVMAVLSIAAGRAQPGNAASPFGPLLAGSGDTHRSVLSRKVLTSAVAPSAPLDDTAAFGIPQNAAEPKDLFEGTITFINPASNGKFELLSDVFSLIPKEESAWRHLPDLKIEFVQSGSHLVPVRQGLVLTSSPVWNYIAGPGRVWKENEDEGYTRAAFPFALIQRNQNCVHNGEMSFLFSNTRKPGISNVYYQITQETCYPMKFNLWGVISARYEPGAVLNADTIARNQADEFARRLPTKPIAELTKDAAKSGIEVTQLLGDYKHKEEVTTYGVVFGGTNYSSGCPTRFGEYAFCEEMRLPSYSIAKSLFAGVALMRLGLLYGTAVDQELAKNWLPQYKTGGNWDTTTFSNISDMATGNYNLPGYEADEDSSTMDTFIVDEGYDAKLKDAFAFRDHFVTPGTKWVYQSSATYIVTQAMNAYLKRKQGADADLFNMVRDDIYIPLHVSQGGLTTIRTDHSASGAPTGYYGLFFIKDDIAKISNFLNNSNGMLEGKQVLEPIRLQEAMFRGSSPHTAGVSIQDSSSTSLLGAPVYGTGVAVAGGRRYAHGFWGRYLSTREFPQLSCNFWVPFMSGYGGNIVAMPPNGVSFYRFSDGNEFPWVPALFELNKLAPVCKK